MIALIMEIPNMKTEDGTERKHYDVHDRNVTKRMAEKKVYEKKNMYGVVKIKKTE